MWSTFKEGFSEFASVVTQDVKNVMNSVQESLNDNNQDDDDYDEGNDDNQDFSSSPKTNNSSSSSKIDPNSPAGVLSKIQPFEFAKDIPDFPSSSSVGQEVLENWKKQVRALQENLHGTYVTPLDEADENSFTPSWLRTGAIDEETGVPNDSSEKELFAVGQQLLRSSQTVRNQFQQLFPEAQHHSLESLQDLIVEINNEQQKSGSETKTQRLLPSSFLVRYVVRLNKLFFHVKHGEYVSQREAAGQAKQIRHQKEKIKEQEETIRNLNEKLSDLEQEKKHMAATISDQETLIRQLRLDLERTKLLLNSNNAAAVSQHDNENNNHANNNNNTRQSSSSVDMIATPIAEVKAVEKESSAKKEKNEDDDEEWTEIA